MVIFRRPYIWLAAILTLVVLLIMMSATPAFCYTKEHSWALTQAFKGAMEDQISRNERYLIPILAVVLVFLGLGAYWFRSQIIKNRTPWGISPDLISSGAKSRREWMRLPVNHYLIYALQDSNVYRKSRVINIGGGGLLFATNQELQPGDNLRIILELEYGMELDLTATVVRFTENTSGLANYKFLAGVKFTDIRKDDQDSIVSMVLSKQRDNIQINK